MPEQNRSGGPDDEWIRPLLTAAADAVPVGPASREQLIADGRSRLARRRALAGTALTAVLAFALGGYAVAGRTGGGPAGQVAVTVSATSASVSSQDSSRGSLQGSSSGSSPHTSPGAAQVSSPDSLPAPAVS